jgi:nucleoside-diphosphate-sugar epimerase
VGRIGRLLRARRLGDLAIRSRDSHGRTMNIGMTAPPRWNDFLVAFGRSIGAVPVARIAGWRLAVEAAVAAPPLYLAKRMLAAPGTIPEPISPALLKLFAQDIALDCTRSHRLLGPPRISLADGLAQSAAWFLETHGLHAE